MDYSRENSFNENLLCSGLSPSGKTSFRLRTQQTGMHCEYGQRTPADAFHGVYSLTHCDPGAITMNANLELTDARLGERPDCA
jgi:hypothetical protein